jgi:(1->4)-alpha-D-glucan 1-alpha-D-glucosylmutase
MSDSPVHVAKIGRRIPGATYRLQFHREFTFRQAGAILDYLRELGITDVYASPLFAAGPESTHGYDVCCFGNVSPQLGGDNAFAEFAGRLREFGLGLLLDMVPNHMGAASANGWWLDVLEHGRDSRYAAFFDIDWDHGPEALRNKVLLPVLEDQCERVVEAGKLRVTIENGKACVAYYDRRFPLDSRTMPESAKSNPDGWLLEVNGRAGEPRSFEALKALLEQQHYRLAWWKTASQEINFRRFFDVADLVALKMESPEVFAAAHELIFAWLKAGRITGLRVDHPDGLWNPREYFARLQARSLELAGVMPAETIPTIERREEYAAPEQAARPAPALYVVAEKILTGEEHLPDDWQVDGTTGYDFLNRVNGLFVDPANAGRFDAIYREFAGCEADFRTVVRRCKRKVLEELFAADLEALTRLLAQVAAGAKSGGGFTETQLRTALVEIIAAFPVYRTYVDNAGLELSARDRAVIGQAIADARCENSAGAPGALEFVGSVLSLGIKDELDGDRFDVARRFVMKFQQLTGPVAAKGVEDTAFYNFNRLVSLNEVGGDPGEFGVAPAKFHEGNEWSLAHWPHTLLASATHDTKRGEDARARLNVLSEMPGEWHEAIRRWRDINRPTAGAPSRNDEYLFYQTVIAAWPARDEDWKAFPDRVTTYLLKAVKEAKAETSWLTPNAQYEAAVEQFVRRVLADDKFVRDAKAFQRRIAFFGRFNSLSQTLLKIASPGVPDFYQGTELWDLSLVDPDNRRPVDYDLRARLLAELKGELDGGGGAGRIRMLLDNDDLGRSKLFLIWRAMNLRRAQCELFERGDYTPLPAFGARREHVIAFARNWEKKGVIAVVPRLVCGLVQGKETAPLGVEVWGDTFIPLPAAKTGDLFRNAITGETVPVYEKDGVAQLGVGGVLKTFPVALLEAAR